jgi:hypothetical protein
MLKKNIMKKRPHNKSILNLIILCLGVIVISLFITSFTSLNKFGSHDLRNRVVGVRNSALGIDPYFAKWFPGMPEELADPRDDPRNKVNRLTVSPNVLLLHYPFKNLSFLKQIYIWYFLQWIALIATILIWVNIAQSKLKKKLIIIFGLLFVSSFSWYSNLLSGQIYIFYVLFVSLAFWLLYRQPKKKLIAIVVLGIVAGMRPPYLLLSVPFIIKKDIQAVIVFLGGLVLSVVMPIAIFRNNLWNSYIECITTWNASIVGKFTRITVKQPEVPPNYYPEKIEGLDFLDKFAGYGQYDTSLKSIIGINIPFTVFIGLWSIVFIYIFIFLYKKRKFLKDLNITLLIGFMLVMITDIFLPAPRYAYYDIQMIIPIFIYILINKNQKSIQFLIMTALTMLALCMPYFLSIVSISICYLWMAYVFIEPLKNNYQWFSKGNNTLSK